MQGAVISYISSVQCAVLFKIIDNDKNRTKYLYIITDYKTVEPNRTDVLNDYGDNRLTVISCTDDGTMRQVVVGILKE